MSSIFSGTLTKIVAQVAALVLVVGGLAAFVITQANADKPVTADAENVEQPSEDQPLDIERVSSITPLSADQIQVPQLMEITVGKETKEILTTGETVQDVLDNANVTVDGNDKVSPKPDQKINPTTAITVTVVEKTEVTEEESVEYETTYENDGTLEKGKTKTDTQGENGVASVTYEVTTENGEEVDKTEINREVTQEPTNAVVLRGTKEEEPEPEPEPEPSTSSDASASESSSSDSSDSSSSDSSSDSEPAASGGAPTSGVWAQLAQCESGGNPRAVNPAGPYYGLYQFQLSTWQSVGGSGLPSEASPAEQTKRAQILQQRAGWGQWPVCAAGF